MFAVTSSSCAVTNVAPTSVTEALIQAGILPTPEKAKETFWSLGSDWWKQIIDGRYHQHGPRVFDDALHYGPRERGYLAGIKKASEFFVEHMDQPLSLSLYRDTHRKAIEHFESVGRNGAGCNWEEIDYFRGNRRSCSGYPIDVKGFAEVEKKRLVLQEAKRIIGNRKPGVPLEEQSRLIRKQWKMNVVPAFVLCEQIDGGETDQEKIEILLDTYEKMTESQREIAVETMENLNSHLEQVARRLGLAETFAEISINSAFDFTITTWYTETRCSVLTIIVEKLFEEFNQNITHARKVAYDLLLSGQKVEEIKGAYQEVARRLIGQLFAELEWVHPWIDGQGRTDLIKLSGLLCREGLHPPILDFPFYSTSNSLELWLDYLNEGLLKFKKLRGY